MAGVARVRAARVTRRGERVHSPVAHKLKARRDQYWLKKGSMQRYVENRSRLRAYQVSCAEVGELLLGQDDVGHARLVRLRRRANKEQEIGVMGGRAVNNENIADSS